MMEDIRAQPGPQEQFLSSTADIAIYGGAAGGGKSYALLLEPLRHLDNPKFGGIIFRRTSPQLTGAGSLWQDASTLYPLVGAEMRQNPYLEIHFKKGGTLQFSHLQHVRDVLSHQGKQYSYIGFDELTHFESSQFWYLVSRLRSLSGVVPYMRCTTNPDPDSFVRKLVDWWIDGNGFPDPGRSGQIRWLARVSGEIHWGDTRQELVDKFGDRTEPLSFTFIGAKLGDNPILNRADPGYKSRLEALPQIERARLLDGNWDIRPEGGKYINREWFAERWTDLPKSLNIYICSDFAVTEAASPDQDPDYTEHGVFGVDSNDNMYVIDWWYDRVTADIWIDSLIDLWSEHDQICWFGEGGLIRHAIEPLLRKRMNERKKYSRIEWVNPTGRSASMSSSNEGFSDRSKQAKAIRGRAFQARASSRKIIFPANAPWLNHVLETVINFPGKGHDDAFDVMSLMCLVIDQAHPAILMESEKKIERDRWQRNQRRQKSWRAS